MTDATSRGSGLASWIMAWTAGWNQFWFASRQPHTLAIIRICCGGMLVYTHVIWGSLLFDFMGKTAWIDSQTIQMLHASDWAWSWLWYTDHPVALVIHQVAAILASLCMMLGLFTRIATPLAWWLTLMVCHRMTLALFGLDQIIIMLSMYLMICRSGSVWSLDSWLRNSLKSGSAWLLPSGDAAISNNMATRLIQIHLCVIYIFGGLSKMRGEMWFDGSALWYTVVNYEYQSMDLTWLGRFPLLIAMLTATTLFWETFYCALVWPRLTRPLVLGMAVLVHGGIALGLGMVTFGFIMIVANLAFIEPTTFQRWVARVRSIPSRPIPSRPAPA